MKNQNLFTLGMQSRVVIKPKLQLALLGFSLYPGDQDFPTVLANGVVVR